MKRFISLFLLAVLVAGSAVFSADAFPVWRGDADGDDKIGTVDAVLLLRKIAGWDIELKDSADFNSDGNINTSDVVNVLRYVAGWDVMNDDLLEATYGVSETYFEVPDPVCTQTVGGSEFGFDSSLEDNYKAFEAASAYLKEHPGTRLELEKGTYRTKKGFHLKGVENCIIDCGGSEFIFYKVQLFNNINACKNVKICNLTEKWDWNEARLGSLVRIKSSVQTPDEEDYFRTVEVEFVYEEDASFALEQKWCSWIQLDPETLTHGPAGQVDLSSVRNRVFNRKWESGNIVTADIDCKDYPIVNEGEYYYITHFSYDAGKFVTIDGASSGVVFEDVNVYGCAGMAFVLSDSVSNIRLTRVTIDLDPDRIDKGQRISTVSDAIHVMDTCGNLILEGCTIGFSGDDCLNIHNNVGVIESISGETINIHAANTTSFCVGETLAFRNGNNYEYSEITAKIVEREKAGKQNFILTLDDNYDGELEDGMVVIDIDRDDSNLIVRDCYFHETYARGLLLGTKNCTVENNTFYRIDQQAINIPVDITSFVWTEGAGTDNMIIRNNVFDSCNILGKARRGTIIDIFARNDYCKDNQGNVYGNCFENILISNNRFINPQGYILRAHSIRNLTFYGNETEYTGSTFYFNPFAESGKISIVGDYYDGSHIIGNRWKKSEYTAEDANKVSVHKNKISKITVSGNVVE